MVSNGGFYETTCSAMSLNAHMGFEGEMVNGLELQVRLKLPGVNGEVNEAASFSAAVGTGEGNAGRSDNAYEVSAPW